MTSLRGLLEEVDSILTTEREEDDDYSHWTDEEHSSYQQWLDETKTDTPLADLLEEVDGYLPPAA